MKLQERLAVIGGQLRNTQMEKVLKKLSPGEAQVDFGNMTVVKDGAYKDIKALVMSFPQSNAGFSYPLPSENTECFLEGLKQLFHQAGGVPTYLRIDNLAVAVVSIGKGDKRTYTDSFIRFKCHYGFEVQPCNPSSGHEKGNVEKKVGYTRNNLFTTEPIMESFPQLATWMKEEMEKDRKRPHYEKDVLIEELWIEDKKHLKPLPLTDLPIFSVKSAKVNKYGEIEVDGEKFVIHKAKIKQTLFIKMEWDKFTCYTNDGKVVYQEARPYMNTTRRIPWNDIFMGLGEEATVCKVFAFFKYLPERVQTYLTIRSEETKSRVKGIKKLLEKYSLNDIHAFLKTEQRFERAPHELGFILEAKEVAYPEKLSEAHTSEILLNYETDLNAYDKRLCPSLEGGVS